MSDKIIGSSDILLTILSDYILVNKLWEEKCLGD